MRLPGLSLLRAAGFPPGHCALHAPEISACLVVTPRDDLLK